MHCLSVGGAGQEGAAGGEGEGEDGGRPLESSPQLIQLCSIPCVEHSDDSSLETGGGDPGVGAGEGDGGQLTLVSRDDHATRQSLRIKHLELTSVAATNQMLVSYNQPMRGEYYLCPG